MLAGHQQGITPFLPMARPRSAGIPEPGVTFEQAMSELEEIVHVLEDSQLPLEELVEKYERGAGLLRICQQRLHNAQQRIELIGRNAAGETVLEPLDAEVEPAPSAAAPQKISRKSPPSDHANDEIRLL